MWVDVLIFMHAWVKITLDRMRDRSRIILVMNKLPTAKRAAVVAALVEGNSIRATARMTTVSKPTILKLLADLGEACAAYHDAHVRQLKSRRVQVDEIWSFIGAKARNVSEEKKPLAWGDC